MSDDDKKNLAKLITQVSTNLDDDQNDQMRNSVKSSDGAEGTITDPLLERLRPILEAVDKLGDVDPDFDMKAYMDEMWGDK